jgi:hypothetical protein
MQVVLVCYLSLSEPQIKHVKGDSTVCNLKRQKNDFLEIIDYMFLPLCG